MIEVEREFALRENREGEFLLESGSVMGWNGMQATVFAKFGHKKCLTILPHKSFRERWNSFFPGPPSLLLRHSFFQLSLCF